MVWREYLASLATTPEGVPSLIPAAPPADPTTLTAAEAVLGVQLPANLHALYGEMDGVDDPSFYLHLIMPASELASANISLRSLDSALYATNFHDFLFFAGRGNGDLFGFPVVDGRVQPNQIVEWNHGLDEITPVAHSLTDFLLGWVRQSGSG